MHEARINPFLSQFRSFPFCFVSFWRKSSDPVLIICSLAFPDECVCARPSWPEALEINIQQRAQCAWTSRKSQTRRRSQRRKNCRQNAKWDSKKLVQCAALLFDYILYFLKVLLLHYKLLFFHWAFDFLFKSELGVYVIA
jgi:hypothetical protein